MDCPACNETMEAGEVELRKSFGNLLVFGWGSTELVFRSDATKGKREIMNSWEHSKAFRCTKCGATLIATRP
ncbi:MAG: PF20097 family protein [Pirellulaceae bacterium]